MTDSKLQTMVAARKAEFLAMQEQPLDKTVKRSLVPQRRKTGMLYDIVYEGGGNVPEELSGAYTGIKSCTQAIEDYKSLLVHKEATKRPQHRSRESVLKDKAGD